MRYVCSVTSGTAWGFGILYKQFAKFAIFGGLGSLLDFATFNLILWISDLQLVLLAHTAGVVAGSSLSYMLNLKFNFSRMADRKWLKLMWWIALGSIVIAGGIALMSVATFFFGASLVSLNLSKGLFICVFLILKFFISKRWIFAI